MSFQTTTDQIFLIAEGFGDGYPNYSSAKIHISTDDPSQIRIQNLFACSPLFSVASSKVVVPNLNGSIRITFFIIKSPFTTIAKIKSKINFDNELWFSIGLSNFIIIEPSTSYLSQEAHAIINDCNDFVAKEIWQLEDGEFKHGKPIIETLLEHSQEFIDIKLPGGLPEGIKFTVSEYIISCNRFLTVSKRFAPQYYDRFRKFFLASNSLLDIIFSTNSDNFDNIGIEKEIKENLGKLIQLNSSLSYIYNQGYSGVFPIFDHFGLVRRHSLLGIGTATNALYELLIQIEDLFFQTPFEDIDEDQSIYKLDKVPDEFISQLKDIETHQGILWENNPIRNHIIRNTNKSYSKYPSGEDYINRLAFYSGRFGFREHDLTATAAIQVLVEASSLQWNIINFTHEIIHDHVRKILYGIMGSKNNLENWIVKNNLLLKKIWKGDRVNESVSFYDFFGILLVRYIQLAPDFGSLTKSGTISDTADIKSSIERTIKNYASIEEDLKSWAIEDFSEIFVHIIDFSYIYNSNYNVFIQTIWASWINVPSVLEHMDVYILRTLCVLASIDNSHEPFQRYRESIKKFKAVIQDLQSIPQYQNATSLEQVKSMLMSYDNTLVDNSLYQRFKNCLPIADLAKVFFVAEMQNYLDRNDNKVFSPPLDSEFEQRKIYYDIDTDSFIDSPISSKVRFMFDQLVRVVHDTQEYRNIEKTSAWLLLSLSSNNDD